jgi:hypothetical protein
VCDIAAGTCAAASAVLYVGGTNADNVSSCGSSTAPCATPGYAAARLSGQAFMRIRDGNYNTNMDLEAVTVTVVGPGASLLAFTDSTPAILIRNGANVTLDGLSIRGATNGAAGVECSGSTLTFWRARSYLNQGPGLDSSSCVLAVLESSIDGNQGIGLVLSNGELVMRRSTIKGNTRGGVHAILAPYEIINNFIVDNGTGGSSGSDIAGMRFDNSSETGDQILAFNTIANNRARDGLTSFGVHCDVSGSASSVVTSNIVHNGQGQTVVAGSCVWSYSNYEGAPVGTRNNIDMDPMFKDELSNNYEIKSGSPCQDAAEDLSTVTTDYEGDARPAGAKDIGADEVDL